MPDWTQLSRAELQWGKCEMAPSNTSPSGKCCCNLDWTSHRFILISFFFFFSSKAPEKQQKYWKIKYSIFFIVLFRGSIFKYGFPIFYSMFKNDLVTQKILIVSHTEAFSDICDDLASSCCYTEQGCPVGPASYLIPRSGSCRTSQITIFSCIWTTDIILKHVCAGCCSSRPRLRTRFHFIGGEKKKNRLTQGTSFLSVFSLHYFFFISGQQTKKSMTPTALIDISMLN